MWALGDNYWCGFARLLRKYSSPHKQVLSGTSWETVTNYPIISGVRLFELTR